MHCTTKSKTNPLQRRFVNSVQFCLKL